MQVLTLDILAEKLRSIGVYGGNAEKLMPFLSKYLYTSLPPSRSQVVSLKHLAENFPELNMANYNPDDVEELNNWGIEIANCAEELAATLPTEQVPEADAGFPVSESDVPVGLPVPVPSGMCLVNAGALQMVINALRRDAEEGKVVRGEMADELLATVGQVPPESNTYRCQAPQGYIRPQEPDSFDGHDYEGFIGGCQRMGCKASAAASPQAARPDAPAVLGWVRRGKDGRIGNHFHTYEPHCDVAVRDDGGEKIAVIAAPVHPAEEVQSPQADALDAARYRFLRDTCWSSDKELATVISLQMNKVWDEKIDEAMARNKEE